MPLTAHLVLATVSLLTADTQGPRAAFTFPLPSALTDAPTLRVSGVAADPAGVLGLTVNGVGATTNDGFATWSAVVPLEPGDNLLLVAAVDGAGNLEPAAAMTNVWREPYLMPLPMGVELDPERSLAYVLDVQLGARIGAIDLRARSTSLITGLDVGRGPDLAYPYDLELDADANRLLVTDNGIDALVTVDLPSGDRAVLSGPGVGSGPDLVFPVGLQLAPAGDHAYVADSGTAGAAVLLAIDLATGDRSEVSGPQVGSGPPLGTGFGLELVAGGTHALVTVPQTEELLDIDLVTGDRTLISSDAVGAGIEFSQPERVTLLASPPAPGVALVADRTLGRLLGVHLATGDRRTLAQPAPFGQPGMPSGLDLDPAGHRALVADLRWKALVAVDLASGDAEALFRVEHGTGPLLETPFGVVVDPWSPHRALVVDAGADSVVAVDLITGARTTLTGAGVGAGPPLVDPVDVCADHFAATPRLLLADSQGQSIVAVDLASGDRSVLSGPSTGAGPPFDSPGAVVLDPDPLRSRALVMDVFGNALVAVDLATGDRTVVSGDFVGSGPTFFPSYDLDVDPSGTRAFAASLFSSAVLAIDLTTGDRTEVSGPGLGSGPIFIAPNELIYLEASDTVLVADVGKTELVEVDLATGDRTVLVGPDPSAGPGPHVLHGVAVLPGPPGAATRLLLADRDFGALLAVDLTPDPFGEAPSAARVLVSR